MIGLVCSGVALATHWISDSIDVSPEARRASEPAVGTFHGDCAPQLSGGDDLDDDMPPTPPLSERQRRSRARVEALLGTKL